MLDPIDATKNYVRGVPVWATLIGLMDGDDAWSAGHRPRARAPLVGRGRRRRVDRPVADQGLAVPGLAGHQAVRASFSYSGVGGWAETGRLDGFLSLSQAVWRTRGFGDFWSHMLVAEGAVDVSAEPEVSLWDLAALQVIVEEAGGRFTSLSGSLPPMAAASFAPTATCTKRYSRISPKHQTSLPAARYVPRPLPRATLVASHFAVTGVPFVN